MAYGTLNAGAITPGSGNTLTVSETVNVESSLKLAGTAITSTAAELNLLDGSSVTNATVSKAVVLDSSGNIALPNTKGISFAATADGGVSTPSELFDDYEEGSFTAIWTGTTTTGTASSHVGYYKKIGNMVVAYANMYSASVSGTWAGNLRIDGLPFTFAQYSVCNIKSGGWDSTNAPQLAFGVYNQTYMNMQKNASADARDNSGAAVDSSVLGGGDEVYFTMTYFV